MIRTRLGLTLLAVVGAGFVTAPTSAGAATIFGFTGASNYNTISNEKDLRVGRLESAAGGQVRRLPLLWREVEGSLNNGVPVQTWGYYDRVIANLRTNGMKPILVLMGAPVWAQNTSECVGGLCPPAGDHLDDWERFAYQVAKRYPDAAAIEIWNEPSLKGQWTTKAGPDPERYARLFSHAAGAIHFANPSIPVLVGSVTYWPQDEPGKRLTITTFLERFYRAGGKAQLRSADGVGLHAYPWITELTTLDKSFAKIMNEIRAVLARFDPTRKIWVTETGVTTSGPWAVSWRAQAKGILTLKRELSEAADVRSVLIHSSIESPYDPNHTHESGYGILKRSDLTPKTAYCALAELASASRSLTGCPAGVLADLGYSVSGGSGSGGSGGGSGSGGSGGGGTVDDGPSSDDGGSSAGSNRKALRKRARRHCRAKLRQRNWWPVATRDERRSMVRVCARRYIRRHG